jgi:hypothetical protein
LDLAGRTKVLAMNDSKEHLGTIALGYLWNHPVQQLNSLLLLEHPEKMDPDLLSAMRKLTPKEKHALKSAITAIFADEVSNLFTALDDSLKRGEMFEIHESGHHFSEHLPPWKDRFSYFDREGNPKAA